MADDTPDKAEEGAPASEAPTSAAPQPAQLREDVLQNAVAFLSHPKVRSSSEASKHSFLERKGLNAEEIAEAFRRVPEPAPGAATPAAATLQPAPGALQATLQHIQPAATPQAAVQYGALPPQQLALAQPQALAPQPPVQQPVRWTQVVLGAGFLAAGAYAVQSLAWPYVRDTYDRWRGRPAPPPRPAPGADEAAAQAEATRAMAEAIAAQTAELRHTLDTIRQLVAQLQDGKAASRAGESEGPGLGELHAELHALSAALSEVAGGAGEAGAPAKGHTPLSAASAARPEHANGVPPSPAAAAAGDGGGLDAGGAEAAEEQGAPATEEEASSWAGPEAGGRRDAAGSGAPSPPPHPPSYMEVLDMLQRGQTPPGIRTDINDQPPDPEAPPPQPRMKPRPKPWELKHGAGSLAGSAAGGSSGSLASLGSAHAGAGPATAVPAPERRDAAGPAAGAAQQPDPQSPPASARRSLAAVGSPASHGSFSPSHPVAAESAKGAGSSRSSIDAPRGEAPAWAAAAEPRGGRSPSPAPAASPASAFQAPRRAASIYEAASAPAPDSPGVIAGRLSPMVLPPPRPEEREQAEADGPHNSLGSGRGRVASPAYSGESGGIGRPASSGWRPPPIPAPTLGSGGAASAGASAGAGASEAAPGSGGGGARVAWWPPTQQGARMSFCWLFAPLPLLLALLGLHGALGDLSLPTRPLAGPEAFVVRGENGSYVESPGLVLAGSLVAETQAGSAEDCGGTCTDDAACLYFVYCGAAAGCATPNGTLAQGGCRLLMPKANDTLGGVPEVVAQVAGVTSGFPLEIDSQALAYPGLSTTVGMGVAGAALQCGNTSLVEGACVVRSALEANNMCTDTLPACRSVTVFEDGEGREATGPLPFESAEAACCRERARYAALLPAGGGERGGGARPPRRATPASALHLCTGIGGLPGPLAVLSTTSGLPSSSFWAPTVYSLSKNSDKPVISDLLLASEGAAVDVPPFSAAAANDGTSWRGCVVANRTVMAGVVVRRGGNNRQPGTEACCRSCRAFNGTPHGCNMWVYCEQEGGCRMRIGVSVVFELAQGDCELRYQEAANATNASPPAATSKGAGVPFVSGFPLLVASPQPALQECVIAGDVPFLGQTCDADPQARCVATKPARASPPLAPPCPPHSPRARPQCVAFIHKPSIFNTAATPGSAGGVGVFKHASDAKAMIMTPTGTLYVRDSGAASAGALAEEGSGSGLSSGAIAGIAVGAVAGAALLAAAAAALMLRRRRQRTASAGAAGKADPRSQLEGVVVWAPPPTPPSSGAGDARARASLGAAAANGCAELGGGAGAEPGDDWGSFPLASEFPESLGLPSLGSEGCGLGVGAAGHRFSVDALPPSLQSWVVKPEEIAYSPGPDGKPQQLGAGASGVVLRAEYRGETVAAKVLALDQGHTAQQAFVTECARLYQLRHHNLVGFVGVAVDGEKGVLLMELDLHTLLPLRVPAGPPLGPGAAEPAGSDRVFSWYRKGRQVAVDVSRAINYLHSNNVAHLDIKSSNVLLTSHGMAKLADVGLSRHQAHTFLSLHNIVGTLAWAAPEILMGRPCTMSVDIYSFGVVLWEIEVANLLKQMMAFEPAARPSVQDVMRQLAALARVPAPKAAPRAPASAPCPGGPRTPAPSSEGPHTCAPGPTGASAKAGTPEASVKQPAAHSAPRGVAPRPTTE
eukprot:scaffold14.g1028.t1